MNNLSKTLFLCLVITMIAGVSGAGSLSTHYGSKNATVTMDTPAGDRGLLDCSEAIDVEVGVVYTINTAEGTMSNVTTYGTHEKALAGNEFVFIAELPDMWVVTLDQGAGDVDGIILGGCDETAFIYGWDDSWVKVNSPSPGTFLFVVDTVEGSDTTFTIVFEEQILPPTTCEVGDVPQVFPGNPGETVPAGTYVLFGDTCGSANTMWLYGDYGYTFHGEDDVYELVLNPGASIQLLVEPAAGADLGLFLVDSCERWDAAPLAIGDDGTTGPEFLEYTNATGFDQHLYLYVDMWGNDACASYEGMITLENTAVANESSSWGALKSQYR